MHFRTLLCKNCILSSIYPLTRIQTSLTQRAEYGFFTKLDVSMQYYSFALDVESQNLCAFCTLFGLYKYLRLSMG